MRERSFIVLHHSKTKDSQTVSWGAIERYHRETMGWQDIGYQAGVELVGGSYYAMLGRPLNRRAAACYHANMNEIGLHVCCVGDYDVVNPDNRMLDVLCRRIVLPWMDQFGIAPQNVIGHRDAGLLDGFDWMKGEYKTCPGTKFPIDLVRKMVS